MYELMKVPLGYLVKSYNLLHGSLDARLDEAMSFRMSKPVRLGRGRAIVPRIISDVMRV